MADPASAFAILVGGVFLVYGMLALLLTGNMIGGATGNSLWIFTVSPVTGVLAVAAALVAIPAATPGAPGVTGYAVTAGIGFIAWGLACAVSGGSAGPAFGSSVGTSAST